ILAFVGVSISVMKKIIFIFFVVLVVSSCKKKESGSSNNNSPTVTTCFKDEQTGIYFGDGVQNSIPFTNSNVGITKISCTSVKIQAPSATYTIGSLSASGVNGYIGTSNTSESSSISFTVMGAQYTVDVSIGNSFQFIGTK
ncbi:MAG: hypothetical protein N2203_05805, partial [Bacteroidia bacterium]|nr:hypothetical protein [Bacteroidia bacterium]